MPIFNNWGKPKDTIVTYMKDIEQKLIPAINNELGISINNYPSTERETYAIYKDQENGISLEISSNNKELENKEDLFVNVSYDHMREEAGIINLNDINDAVEIVNIALHELGFKTSKEKEQEKAAEEEKKQQELEKKKQDLEAGKERNRQLLQDIKDGKYDKKEPKETEPEEDEDNYDEEKSSFLKELKSSFDYVASLKDGEQVINTEWIVPISSEGVTTQFGHISVDATHIAGNNFYLENKKIKPKISTTVNAEKAESYIEKVSDKIRTIPVITITDKDGKEIKVPQEYQDEPLDLDIDL